MVSLKQVTSFFLLAVIATCQSQTTEVAKPAVAYNAAGAYDPYHSYDYSGYQQGYTGSGYYNGAGTAGAYGRYPYTSTPYTAAPYTVPPYNAEYCRRYPTIPQCANVKGYPYQTGYTGKYNAYNPAAYGAYNTPASYYNSAAYNPATYNPAAYNSAAYNPGAYNAGQYWNPAQRWNAPTTAAAAYNQK